MTGLVRRKIGFKTAGKLLVIAFSLLAAFHVLVLTGVVPPEIVWGGHAAESPGSLLMLELVALGMICLFTVFIAVRTGLIGISRFPIMFEAGSWLVFGYLLFNTFLNFASGVSAEKLIFTPVSIVLAVLAFRVAVGDHPQGGIPSACPPYAYQLCQ